MIDVNNYRHTFVSVLYGYSILFKRIILGRVQMVNNNSVSILGSYIKPLGLLSKRQKGILGKRSQEVLNDPDPNNCIFILIDRI